MSDYKKIIKKAKIKDFNKYNEMFDIQIIVRGELLFKNKKIKNLQVDNNKYSCNIKGTEKYNLFVEFDKKDNIIKMECDCPYYKKGNNCKHLYALIIEAKLKNNYNKLINLQKDTFDELEEQFQLFKKYFKTNINKYLFSAEERINSFIDYYENKNIPRYNLIISKETTQMGYLKNILELEKEKKLMREDFYKLKNNEQDFNNSTNNNGVGSDGILFSIFKGIINGIKSPSTHQIHEQNLKKWALEELERGNPEPYISEYNELEDDMFQDYE